MKKTGNRNELLKRNDMKTFGFDGTGSSVLSGMYGSLKVKRMREKVPLGRLELPTHSLGNCCSIH
jgi:hypothetical protein